MPRQLRREFAGAIYHLMNRAERPVEQEAKAQRVVREETSRLRGDDATFRQAGKGDEPIARLAARRRKEPTMSLQCIAQHLEMGRWNQLSNLLPARRKQENLQSENRHLHKHYPQKVR
jgi:hypothetical protein